MGWQYHPLLLVFFLGGIVALGIGAFCLQYVRRHGFSYLVGGIGLLGFHDAVWAFAAAFKTASTGLESKLLFYKIEFLGSWVAPSLTLVIALAFVGWDRWLTRRTLAALVAVPAVGIPLVVVNPGQAMIVDPELVRFQGIVAFEHSFPPVFALFLAWGIGTATLAALVIGYGAVAGTVPWKPALLGVLVFLVPVIVVALKVGGIYPPDGDGVNLTPAANAFALSVLAVTIVRYRLFEFLPVGRANAVEVMGDGYVLVGPDETILDANGAAAELLAGRSDAGIEGRLIRDLVPEYDRVVGSDASGSGEFETDGRTVEVRSSTVTRQHQTVGRVLLLQDVTGTRRRERRLERTNERLDRFASVVSHDLRNPLNVAKGRLELAREERDDENLATVATALERMASLIDDVLTLARQGRPISGTDPVELSSVAEDCWSVVDGSGAALSVEGDLRFEADRDRLRQLVENLFRNAVEHGRSDVTIRVGALADGRGFYVEDDGPGIPESDREDVFEFGYSTASSGTGFGLAIVQEIAQAHEWTVEVTEGAGGGARFEVTGVQVAE